jgi:hypothetical protein
MARGFESKDVEYQQAERERGRASGPALSGVERDEATRRRSIELALARSRSELATAASPAHRRKLEQAIAELLRQLTAHV